MWFQKENKILYLVIFHCKFRETIVAKRRVAIIPFVTYYKSQAVTPRLSANLSLTYIPKPLWIIA